MADYDCLRKTAAEKQWKLVHDVQLRKKLENISTNLQMAAEETNNQFIQLKTKMEKTQTKLGLITNQFINLSSHQFIENRVEDDSDEIVFNRENKPKEEAVLDPELPIKNASLALTSGLEFVEVQVLIN